MLFFLSLFLILSRFHKFQNMSSCCGQLLSLKISMNIPSYFLNCDFWHFFGPKARGSACILSAKIPYKNVQEKIIFYRCFFFTKWFMTKVDRSKNTYFLFCEIFIKSKCYSKKFDFIMLFPIFALTTLSKWILS